MRCVLVAFVCYSREETYSASILCWRDCVLEWSGAVLWKVIRTHRTTWLLVIAMDTEIFCRLNFLSAFPFSYSRCVSDF